MIIEIRGGEEGAANYLRTGKKAGRGYTRDELDERVVLAGDLNRTEKIIVCMTGNGEKYLHLSLGFREYHVDQNTLLEVVEEFRTLLFIAYANGEYDFYAEAHLPRIKAICDKDGTVRDRLPHIHILIPKVNLLNGRHLNPLGLVKRNVKFIDAIQEHLNNKFGFASPKECRRIDLTDSATIIQRFNADHFSRDRDVLKREILQAVLYRGVSNWTDFGLLLNEFGQVSLRNPGRDNAYFFVKPAGAPKGINLRDFPFSREFIDASGDTRFDMLRRAVQHDGVYRATGPQRPDPSGITALLEEWKTRAQEIKYLNSGRKAFYKRYKAANAIEKARILADLECGFYSKWPLMQEVLNAQSAYQKVSRTERLTSRFDGFDSRADTLSGGFGSTYLDEVLAEYVEASGATTGRITSSGLAGYSAQAESIYGLSNLSRRRFDDRAGRSEVLLPTDATVQLERRQVDRARRVRRLAARSDTDGLNSIRFHDSVVGQILRDFDNYRQKADAEISMTGIKQRLDGHRLLRVLARLYGITAARYRVSKTAKGDRILAGRRSLNVSNFLTEEMQLRWAEAEKILRSTYTEQLQEEKEAQSYEVNALEQRRSSARRDPWRSGATWTSRDGQGLVVICVFRGIGYVHGGQNVASYSPEVRGDLILYQKRSGQTAFIDAGVEVEVMATREIDDVKAAMRLAVAKWGRIEIDGPPNYRHLCAMVAVQEGFQVTNLTKAEFASAQQSLNRVGGNDNNASVEPHSL